MLPTIFLIQKNRDIQRAGRGLITYDEALAKAEQNVAARYSQILAKVRADAGIIAKFAPKPDNKLVGADNEEFNNKHPRQTGGKFGAKMTHETPAGQEFHADDIAQVTAGKGGLHVGHKDGSNAVVAPEHAEDFLNWHSKHASQQEAAAQMVSPNQKTHLSLDQSVANLSGERMQWLQSVCADVDKYVGLNSHTLPAVGEWPDPQSGKDTEQSLFTAISRVPDAETLKYAAALKGLAANQKSVLNIVFDPKGQDTMYHVSIPHDTSDVGWKRNLAQLQGVLDQEGIDSRSFVKTAHGTDVVIFEQGGQEKLDAVKRFAQHFGGTSENTKCTGEYIGDYQPKLDDAGQRAASAQAFRTIIYGYEKQHNVHYEIKEQPPEETGGANRPAQGQPRPQAVRKSIGGAFPLLSAVLSLRDSRRSGTITGGGQ